MIVVDKQLLLIVDNIRFRNVIVATCLEFKIICRKHLKGYYVALKSTKI